MGTQFARPQRPLNGQRRPGRTRARTHRRIGGIDQRIEQSEREVRAPRSTRGLLEASLDPLVTISPEGKITDVNEATEAATGVPREPTDRQRFLRLLHRARSGPRRLSAGAVRRARPGLSADDPSRLRPHDRRALQRRRLQERGGRSAGRLRRRPRRDRAKAGRRTSQAEPRKRWKPNDGGSTTSSTCCRPTSCC